MSGIKILRSFVNFKPSFDENRYIPIGENKELTIEFYHGNERYDFSVGMVINRKDHTERCEIRLFAHHKNGYYHIWFWDKIKVIHPDAFQDSDDLILILKYGRNILDENIIDLHNETVPNFKIELSDFDAFNNLAGI